MSHIDGQIGTIDLTDPQPSDYFKIGVAHGENGFAQEPTYTSQPAYLEGYAFGQAMAPYLFGGGNDGYLDRTLTYDLLSSRFPRYSDLPPTLTYDQLTNLKN